MNRIKKSAGEIALLYQRELNTNYPVQEIKAILYQLFYHILGWSRSTVHLNKGVILQEEADRRFMNALGRLIEGEPIQYIIGQTEFCGLRLAVQPGVLIPRPETEELAVMITRDNLPYRDEHISVLDIGTGSGCIALAMKRAFPAASVTGIDKSPDAIAVARKNAIDNNLDVTFLEADILNPTPFSRSGLFHVIVSNPPYIPQQERAAMSRHVVDHEPENALFVPDDNPLIFYEAIALYARNNLTPDGLIYVEIHENYSEDTMKLFRSHRFSHVTLYHDYFGKKRFLKISAPF
jgi:release factor glutamine methyltransferase